MTSPRALLLATVASIPLLGCDDSPSARPALVRDSAGVTIVDHGRVELDALPQWVLGAMPAVRIGTVDGEEAYQFYDVQDVRRVGDGSIAVLDGSRTLRLFDADGRHLWTAGGDGEGPGEFRFASMVREISDDSLVVWDIALQRLSVFTPGGRFTRVAMPNDVEANALAWGMPEARRVLIEARHLERTTIDGHAAGVFRSDFYHVDLDGTTTRELGRRLIVTEYQEVDERGAYSPAIFATPAVVGPSPDGLWYGDANGYELREEVGADEPRTIVRWQGPDRTVTDRDVEAVLALWTEEVHDPALRRFLERYGETHPRADRFPAYEALRVDRIGRLWVRDYVKEHEDDGLRRWTVFSADGTEILGRLTHPAVIEPYDVGRDWLLGVERDELDVEWVTLYDILPRK